MKIPQVAMMKQEREETELNAAYQINRMCKLDLMETENSFKKYTYKKR